MHSSSIQSPVHRVWEAIQPANRKQFLTIQLTAVATALALALINRPKMAVATGLFSILYSVAVNKYPVKRPSFELCNLYPTKSFSENPSVKPRSLSRYY